MEDIYNNTYPICVCYLLWSLHLLSILLVPFRLGHREQKDEWTPRLVEVFQRHNVLPPNAVVAAGAVSSACTAGTFCYVLIKHNLIIAGNHKGTTLSWFPVSCNFITSTVLEQLVFAGLILYAFTLSLYFDNTLWIASKLSCFLLNEF